MKYRLDSSNFKVGYKSYSNPLHPYPSGTGPSIFDVAIIIDRSTKKILKENKKLTPVGTAQVGNGHACHAMVLDCVLADLQSDNQGKPVLDSNGDPELKNYSFKFKNTYRNGKEIELKADHIKSPTVFYYINIDFIPELK